MAKTWRQLKKLGNWWHFDINWLWTSWSFGILFDSGRYKNEQAIMFLLFPVIIRIHWRKKL